MQFGTVYTKIVTRKLQGSGRAVQYMMLAGFELPLTHKTAMNWQDLGTAYTVNPDKIEAAQKKMVEKNSATGFKDVTNSSVANKLDRMFGEPGELPGEFESSPKFAALGIGRYL